MGLLGWRRVWTLLAWCEKREAYRNFRFDRISSIELLDETYPDHPTRSLIHYLEVIIPRENGE